ncbi:hypothetical protein LCGC14_1732290 [marine sediment metagenome]|uniref:Uncharacterized protein n=1 Tax=marine sediment metagenome TaxID=412755 RepID=A0A0F9H8Z7_9ZZZZ
MERRQIVDENYLGCQDSCHVIRQERSQSDDLERVVEDLKRQLREKEKKIKGFESVKEYIKNDLNDEIIDEFFKVFEEIVEGNMPIYNSIRDKVSSYEKIKAVFLHSKEELYDLWFIIEENNFDLKHKISEIFCEIVDSYDSLVFDIMVLTNENVDLDELEQESYKTIYIKN